MSVCLSVSTYWFHRVCMKLKVKGLNLWVAVAVVVTQARQKGYWSWERGVADLVSGRFLPKWVLFLYALHAAACWVLCNNEVIARSIYVTLVYMCVYMLLIRWYVSKLEWWSTGLANCTLFLWMLFQQFFKLEDLLAVLENTPMIKAYIVHGTMTKIWLLLAEIASQGEISRSHWLLVGESLYVIF